jgi:hypothetical protein
MARRAPLCSLSRGFAVAEGCDRRKSLCGRARGFVLGLRDFHEQGLSSSCGGRGSSLLLVKRRSAQEKTTPACRLLCLLPNLSESRRHAFGPDSCPGEKEPTPGNCSWVASPQASMPSPLCRVSPSKRYIAVKRCSGSPSRCMEPPRAPLDDSRAQLPQAGGASTYPPTAEPPNASPGGVRYLRSSSPTGTGSLNM